MSSPFIDVASLIWHGMSQCSPGCGGGSSFFLCLDSCSKAASTSQMHLNLVAGGLGCHSQIHTILQNSYCPDGFEPQILPFGLIC